MARVIFSVPVRTIYSFSTENYESFVESMFTYSEDYGWEREDWADRGVWIFKHHKYGDRLLPKKSGVFSDTYYRLQELIMDIAKSSSSNPAALASHFGATVLA